MLAELVWQCVAMTRRVRPVLAVAVIFVGLTVAGCVLGRSREEPAGPRVTGMAPRSMFAPRKPPAGLSLESVVTGPTLAGIPTAVYGARGELVVVDDGPAGGRQPGQGVEVVVRAAGAAVHHDERSLVRVQRSGHAVPGPVATKVGVSLAHRQTLLELEITLLKITLNAA